MATKPTETLNFEPSGTAAVEIPSGKQAVGFLPGEKPPAQYLSWIFRTLSRLYNYVKDGQFTGNHTITGTLGVTGATSITGNTTITGTLSASGLITATAGVTAAANQHLGVSGTGRHKHGEYELPLHPSLFKPANGTASSGTQFISTFAPSGGFPVEVYAPIVLPVGKRITKYIQDYDVNGTSTLIDIRIRRLQRGVAGASTAVGGAISDGTGTGLETGTISAINHTIEAGYTYLVVVEINAAAQRIYSGAIYFDDP